MTFVSQPRGKFHFLIFQNIKIPAKCLDISIVTISNRHEEYLLGLENIILPVDLGRRGGEFFFYHNLPQKHLDVKFW